MYIQYLFWLLFLVRTALADEDACDSGSERQILLQTHIKGMPAAVEERTSHLSVDIGNVVSNWYFGSLPFEHRLREGSRHHCRTMGLQQPVGSFGHFLVQQLDIGLTALKPEAISALQRLELEPMPHLPIYDTGVLRLVSNELGHDLRQLMHDYASRFDPSLLEPLPARHCVVHYRVGDLVAYTKARQVISTESIASAVASLRPHGGQTCATVEILNGGANHAMQYGGSKERLSRAKKTFHKSSEELLTQLRISIQATVPQAKVYLQTGGTPDEDLFKMALAPGLVIGAGSFALSGALAGSSNQVRSPAAKHLLEVFAGQLPPFQFRPGWSTFAFAMSAVNTSDWE